MQNTKYVAVKIPNNQNCVNCGAILSIKDGVLKCDYCGQYHEKQEILTNRELIKKELMKYALGGALALSYIITMKIMR